MKRYKSYENYLEINNIPVHSEDFAPSESLAAAEPDLVAAVEPGTSDELRAAIEVIHDGALQKLSAIQQQIFQLSIVEGMSDKNVLSTLGLEKAAFKYHLKQIGFVLRKRCEKKLLGL